MKHNTINCPAGHHIYEGRWLKNPKYISEYIDFWLNKSGEGIRQYSFWIADAFLAFNNIHRNDSIMRKQLKSLINNYNEWEKIRKEKDKVLFFQYDDRDGMELTVSGRKLNNGTEIFGIESVRPTINSYMYADAKAISKISFVNNDIETGGTIYTSSGLICEGATQDDFETALNVVDPTADRTILLPDASGTILVTGSTGDISGTMIANDTVSEANMADDAIGQDQLKSVVELKILNSSGTVVKTLFGAGA